MISPWPAQNLTADGCVVNARKKRIVYSSASTKVYTRISAYSGTRIENPRACVGTMSSSSLAAIELPPTHPIAHSPCSLSPSKERGIGHVRSDRPLLPGARCHRPFSFVYATHNAAECASQASHVLATQVVSPEPGPQSYGLPGLER